MYFQELRKIDNSSVSLILEWNAKFQRMEFEWNGIELSEIELIGNGILINL